MKYATLLLLSFLLVCHSKSQDSTITLSQFELFNSQPHKVLKTELKEVVGQDSRIVTVFKTTDLISGTSMQAVRIGYIGALNIPDLVNPQALYFDFDELDAIINALTHFLLEAEKPRPETDVQLSYITSNDIVLSYSYNRITGAWRFHLGKIYKHLRTPIPGTNITYYNQKRITQLVEDLKTAKSITLTKP